MHHALATSLHSVSNGNHIKVHQEHTEVLSVCSHGCVARLSVCTHWLPLSSLKATVQHEAIQWSWLVLLKVYGNIRGVRPSDVTWRQVIEGSSGSEGRQLLQFLEPLLPDLRYVTVDRFITQWRLTIVIRWICLPSHLSPFSQSLLSTFGRHVWHSPR